MEKSLFRFTVRDMTEIGFLVALSVILDQFVRIKIGATGGSINISCIPLFIIALRHGWFKGLISSGVIYGLICCLVDSGNEFGIASYPFDYLFAYGGICLTSLFSKSIFKNIDSKDFKKKLLSILILSLCVVIWFVIRVLSSSVNSVLFYGYTYWAGIIYAFTYMLPSAALDLIGLIILLPTIKALNKEYTTEFLK